MNIKQGDKVKILSGKDRGKIGKVLQVWPALDRVSVEGLNLAIKHLRPRRQNEKGQRIEFPAPLNAGKLMLVCPKCSRPTRVSHAVEKLAREGGAAVEKKVRRCKKCQQLID